MFSVTWFLRIIKHIKNKSLPCCLNIGQSSEGAGKLRKIVAAQNFSAELSTETVDAFSVAQAGPVLQQVTKNRKFDTRVNKGLHDTG
jgi:hypothetical protein